MRRINFALIVILVACSTGATCVPRRSLHEFQPPKVFDQPPDVNQIAEVINRSRNIQQIQSNTVTVRVQDYPALSARMVWERPRKFRMKGGLSRITGDDFDLGSNDEMFWMATRHGQAPTVYYARHEPFALQLERQILPVSPEWLIEALGIVELDPTTLIGSPRFQADGLIEIESTLAAPTHGQFRRTLVVDPKSGVIRQVLLRDESGRLLATSFLLDHEYYSAVQTSLPRTVKAQLIPVGGPPLNLELNFGSYTVNDNQGQDPDRWTPPNPSGYQLIDLVQRNAGNPLAARLPEYQPAPVGTPQVSYRGVHDMDSLR